MFDGREVLEMFISITPDSKVDRIEFDTCTNEVRLYYANGRVTVRRFTEEELTDTIVQIDF